MSRKIMPMLSQWIDIQSLKEIRDPHIFSRIILSYPLVGSFEFLMDNRADNWADNWADYRADNWVDNWVDNRVDNWAGNRADNLVDNQVDNQMQKKFFIDSLDIQPIKNY